MRWSVRSFFVRFTILRRNSLGKKLFIAEKPSVAAQFAQALQSRFTRRNGYLESEKEVLTWCVGHLVTMSYPDAYDSRYKRWSLDTIPFIPQVFRYEVIDSVRKQFQIVASLLNRKDVDLIYICTDSGREGEYIYRLVDQEAQVQNKVKKRVWIDSQTEEEILRGIREAKDDSAYDNLGAAAFLRAKEDYLMGINFSRALTLKYRRVIQDYLKIEKCVVSVGRVMTCVLGMVVNREREIRNFTKNTFYRIDGEFTLKTQKGEAKEKGASSDREGCSKETDTGRVTAFWKVMEGSRFFQSPLLYNERGFQKRQTAQELVNHLEPLPREAILQSVSRKQEVKNAPLLYNLAELQNDCSKFFKISPDQTLAAAQELYEKKLTTYPRTDARVLSSAVAKEIVRNISGLQNYPQTSLFARAILQHASYKGIEKTRYVNDQAITDHYAIIPTGQGLSALGSCSPTVQKVYECIARRFLAIFYPSAKYMKVLLSFAVKEEHFFSNFRIRESKGYLHVMDYSFLKKKEEESQDPALLQQLSRLRKGMRVHLTKLEIKEGETSPPKRYNSGSMILAMENAGQFIEDEELREQIRGCGIGTSATRAEILKKLMSIRYLHLDKKTQVITPTQMGEMVYEAVALSMKPMLNPALTASWEKGLSGVAEGRITEDEYMKKLDDFVRRRTEFVKGSDYSQILYSRFEGIARNYKKAKETGVRPV